jgi:hypothetical protein
MISRPQAISVACAVRAVGPLRYVLSQGRTFAISDDILNRLPWQLSRKVR